MLVKVNKIELLEPKRPVMKGVPMIPKYCLFYRIVGHPTKDHCILKDKVQVFVETNVLRLSTKKKKVATNMFFL